MNEVTDLDARIRDALRLEAGAARFDPDRWRPATGQRRRARRLPGRLVAVAAASLLLVGLVVPVTVLSLLDRTDPPPERRTLPGTATGAPDNPRTWKECRSEPPDEQEIDPPVGPPRTLIEIWGAVDSGDGNDGQPGPAPERLRVWWNLDPAAWESALAGDPRPAVEGQAVFEVKGPFLAYYPGREPNTVCPYQIIIDAPEAPAGTYPIVVLYGGYAETASWSSLPAVEFTLVPGCPSGNGPWADPDCPEAAWMRRVIDRAGFRVTGETERAVLVEPPNDPAFAPWELLVQVMPADEADRNGSTPASDEAYHRLPQWEGAPGVRVWTDGETYSWDQDGIRVWVLPGPREDPFPREAVDALIYSSTQVESPFGP